MPAKPKTKPAAKAPQSKKTLAVLPGRNSAEAPLYEIGKRIIQMSPEQRALIAEFTGIVQHMPTSKVRPLVELLKEIRSQSHVNLNLFEMIKRHTSVDVPDSYADFANFLQLMGDMTTLHAEHIRKALSRLGEHGEKSLYRTIGHEIKSLKEGIRRGAEKIA